MNESIRFNNLYCKSKPVEKYDIYPKVHHERPTKQNNEEEYNPSEK